MNTRERFLLYWFALPLLIFTAPTAKAGLTLSLQVSRGNDGQYLCYASLATNATAPSAALGTYVVSSPTNAWVETFQLTASGMSYATYNRLISYPDFNSFNQQLTNTYWTILVTNATSTNLYSFRLTTTGFSSNSLPQVTVLFPVNGSSNVTNNPTFRWQGAASWPAYIAVEDYNDDFSFFQSGFLSGSATNWNSPVTLPNGNNTFYMYYGADVSSTVVASTPTNGANQAISGWVSTATLNSSAYSMFTATNNSGGGGPGGSGAGTGHTNVAWYTFEDHNLFAHDYSGHTNNAISYGYFSGSTNMPYFTNDATAGSYAAAFTGAGYISLATNLMATLSGSFSASVWMKPLGIHGNDSDAGSSGAGVLAGNYDQVIPIALTGHKVAFQTGSSGTLHSSGSITTGAYTHVVVTRDGGSGEKKIYINGALDQSGSGAAGTIGSSMAAGLYLGMNSTYAAGLNGILDEVQIYAGVLSSNEVAQLFQNPGTVIADVTAGGNLSEALNATNLTWGTSGDANWFVETTNTHDNVSAAQSGGVTNGQVSVLSATVTGPGTVTFWWATHIHPSETYFDLEFDVDGVYQDDIYWDTGWLQESAVTIPAGQHTLTWTAYGGDFASDAGFVDQVNFTPITPTNVLQSGHFEIVLANDRSLNTPGGGYYARVFLSATPDPITVDEVVSPTGKFYTYRTNSFYSSPYYYQVLGTWAELANECTNGLWTLYVNKGHPSEKQFYFPVILGNIDTNLLNPVTILTPTNGSVNVATNTPIVFTRPNNTNVYMFADVAHTNFGFLDYYLQSGQLPGNSTNWIPDGPLDYGTNFAIVVAGYSLPFLPTPTPTNAISDTISNWYSDCSISASCSSAFVVGAPAPIPVQVFAASAQSGTGTFSFGFQTVAGRPEIVQMSTNMTTWSDVTNFIGDGSTFEFTFPTASAPGAYFRVVTQ